MLAMRLLPNQGAHPGELTSEGGDCPQRTQLGVQAEARLRGKQKIRPVSLVVEHYSFILLFPRGSPQNPSPVSPWDATSVSSSSRPSVWHPPAALGQQLLGCDTPGEADDKRHGGGQHMCHV